MKISGARVLDLMKLAARGPQWRRVFLRQEWGRLQAPLWHAAGFYRRHVLLHPRIVAIIGSLGKSTTRRVLASALDCPERDFSYSNYGVYLAENLLRIHPEDNHAVLEVGISAPGFMWANAGLVRPRIVVITSIASDHSRSFTTLEATRHEKAEMVRGLPPEALVLANGDDPHVRWMAAQTRARVYFYGFGAENDFRAENYRARGDGGCEFTACWQGESREVKGQLPGRHMVYPLLAGLAMAWLEGLNVDGALQRLAAVLPEPGRMTLVDLPQQGIRLIDDTYKNSPESLEAALQSLQAIPAGRRIVVLGDFTESPPEGRKAYREIGRRIAAIADELICLGTHNLSSVRAGAMEAGMSSASARLLGQDPHAGFELLADLLRPGDVILVKGRQDQRLARLIERLAGKPVTCAVRTCNVKVNCCGECPLLTAPPEAFQNHFIRRYLKW